MSAYIQTRIQVGDYAAWRPMFDADRPRAREKARRVTLYRNVADPNEVFIWIELASVEDATEARERLLASGVLDRFEDLTTATGRERGGMTSEASDLDATIAGLATGSFPRKSPTAAAHGYLRRVRGWRAQSHGCDHVRRPVPTLAPDDSRLSRQHSSKELAHARRKRVCPDPGLGVLDASDAMDERDIATWQWQRINDRRVASFGPRAGVPLPAAFRDASRHATRAGRPRGHCGQSAGQPCRPASPPRD